MGPDSRPEGGGADLMCAVRGHIWSDPYSFGGKTWHRDCHRCFTTEQVPISVLQAPPQAPLLQAPVKLSVC